MSFFGKRVSSNFTVPVASLDEPEGLVESVIRNLIAKGICDDPDVQRGRLLAAQGGLRLDRVLVKVGVITEKELAWSHAETMSCPIIAIDEFPAVAVLIGRLSPKFLRRARVCPVRVIDGHLILAVEDGIDLFTPRAIAAAAQLKVCIKIAYPIELDEALERLYPTEAASCPTIQTSAADWRHLDDDIERVSEINSEKPVIRMVDQIVSRAVENRASDIHIEPLARRLRVRYRYDGVLHDVDTETPDLLPAIVSRLKILAKLDIAEQRRPQDGRIRVVVRGNEIDLRISTVPTQYGETVALRVLDRSSVDLVYANLGIAKDIVQAWTSAVCQPNGMVLVTGPTGSGKTTTLYTALSGLDCSSRKVITIENPIECTLEGAMQIQVDELVGLTFASLLRSVLRQDPDVIMVGEIRDFETAQVATQAALTGHMVLSTLHTNSASAVITRLRDMGVESSLVAATLRGVLAQRLVRRLCESCKVPAKLTTSLISQYDLVERFRNSRLELWDPVGCAKCRGTGYNGRQAIAEFLKSSASIIELIHAGATDNVIEAKAVEEGMVRMFDVGMAAVIVGTTTIAEVVRNVGSA